MKKGVGFGDLAAQRLYRETELDRILTLLNWRPLGYRLEKLCRKEDGRPPYPALTMFRSLLLAQWYGLGDRDLEEALRDRLSFRRFAGLSIEDDTPDHSTLCRFRERLREAGLERKLLDLINEQLEGKGFVLKRGTLIDATIVETAGARPKLEAPPEEITDPDAAFVKREGKAGSVYGYKAHVAADEGSLLVRSALLTPANVGETVVADELIALGLDSQAIYADKAYDTHARRAFLAQRGVLDRIMRRGNKHHPLSPEDRRHNASASKTRSRVETIFAVFKRGYGFRRTRYFDIISNQLQLTLLAIAFNLRRALAIARNATIAPAA